MTDPLAAYYERLPENADAECIRELLRQWLPAGIPGDAPDFLRRTPYAARIAAGRHLPAMLRDVTAHLRQRAATPGHLLSGPYAGALPGLARAALRSIGERARIAAELLGVPDDLIAEAIGG